METTTLKPYSADWDLSTIPEAALKSEWGRRTARKRSSYTGGILWKKHNPDATNCRCPRCMTKRGWDVK